MTPPAPQYTEERKDFTTRRLITGFQDKLEAVSDEVSSVSGRLEALKENTVSHKGMMGWAGGLVVAVVLAVLWIQERYEASAAEKLQRAEAKAERTEKAVEEAKAEFKAEARETRLDVRALERAILTRRPQERLRRPLPEPIAEESP